MKHIWLIFVLCIFSIVRVSSQENPQFRVVDTTFVFTVENYRIIPDFDDENAIRIATHTPTEEQPFPGLMISCGIFEDEAYADFSVEFMDEVVVKNEARIALSSHEYLNKNYIQHVTEGEISQVSFLDKTMQGYWRKKLLFIYPFHYDYPTKTLSLCTKVQLRVRMRKYSEQYRPFIEDGKEWITGQLVSSERNKNIYSEISRIYFDGDTLVGGYLCKRWMKQSTHLLESENSVSSTLIAPIFEENRQVFFFYPNETIPRLLYDFRDQNEKQRIEVYSIYDDTHQPHTFVRSACTKDYDSDHYPLPTRWYAVNPIDDHEGFNPQTWIEGVGSKMSPDFNIFGKSETYPVMSKCIAGNAVLCHWWTDDLTSIHDLSAPEMVNGQSSNGKWYDLTGRRIGDGQWKMDNGQLPRGVYIRDGKKVLVK